MTCQAFRWRGCRNSWVHHCTSLSSYHLLLTKFEPATLPEIAVTLPSKSCSLDPICIWLLKHFKYYLSNITPPAKHLVSAQSFPKQIKIWPSRTTHQKLTLDLDSTRSYRPISNLSFGHSFICSGPAYSGPQYWDLYISPMHQPTERRGIGRCVRCMCALCRVKEGRVGVSSLSGISKCIPSRHGLLSG